MIKERSAFTDCTELSNTCILAADDTPIQVAGRGTAILVMKNGKTMRLKDCLHVPELVMTLLSVRVHRRRGAGCCFIADCEGCTLTFPTFSLPIDNTKDCALGCDTLESLPTTVDCDNGAAAPHKCGSIPNARRTCVTWADHERPLLSFQVRTRGQAQKEEAAREIEQNDQTPTSTKGCNSKVQQSTPLDPTPDSWFDELALLEELETTVEDSWSDDECDSDAEDETNETVGVQHPFDHDADGDDINDRCGKGELPPPRSQAVPPNNHAAELHKSKQPVRVTNHRLHSLFGNRKLKDHGLLSQTFSNCKVDNRGEVPLTLGSVSNQRRRHRGKESSRPHGAGHTICADVGCGDGTSLGGHRCCLVLVDKATCFSWTHGL